MAENARTGKFIESTVVAGESYRSFIPPSLPPNPPLEMSRLYKSLDLANNAIGRLDGMSMVLPEPSLFLYMYIRKEAVLSSQIEGTQSSLSDLLLFETDEAPGAPQDDVREVSCYVKAMYYGLGRLEEFPLSLRLIREIHEQLMTNARGGDRQPGHFRTSQNWIGGTRPGNAVYVPPAPEQLQDCLDNFEKFLHDDSLNLPILIKAALAHVQFESIHPFLDGNGRLGRLLITFILCSEGLLNAPLLYLSLYFKTHRQTYYDLLQSVRITGDWENWIQFFLDGVAETANQATLTAQSVISLFKSNQSLIEKSGKATTSLLSIHNYLQNHPITSSKSIKEACHVSLPTVLRSLQTLEKMNIVKEITNKERHKVFVYQEYLTLLNEGPKNK
ncbi:MAG: Fic family protein [Verrucomicrobiota bacterium]